MTNEAIKAACIYDFDSYTTHVKNLGKTPKLMLIKPRNDPSYIKENKPRTLECSHV